MSIVDQSRCALKETCPEDLAGELGPIFCAFATLRSVGRPDNFEKAAEEPAGDPDGNEHALSFQHGRIQVDGMSFSPIHLRDHCRSPQSFHPITRQRLFDTFSLPKDLHPVVLRREADEIHITWSDNGHQSRYPISFLRTIAPDVPVQNTESSPSKKTLWTEPLQAETHSPSVTYDSLTSSRTSLLQALDLIHQHGVVFIKSVPPTAEATESLSLLLSNNHPRRTHYDTFWEFTADLKHGDLAYSNQSLPPHTDTTYFEDPCGLQIFHLLEHSGPDAQGGETTLVDGFACAEILRKEDEHSFNVLSRVQTGAHALGTPGYAFHTGPPGAAGFPALELEKRGSAPKEKPTLRLIRWNNEDRSKLGAGWGVGEVDEWYNAARAFDEILKRESSVAKVKLKPGIVVVIDNHRVLHGRTSFTGFRKMCGAYVGKDEWLSLRRVLRREQNHLARVGQGTSSAQEDVYEGNC
ncbi:Predicted gamma-butyrobetaine,2-oxoglutarate dioxygenase [Phaffia rhodozyma]|uniref:trimethyllysine dioxygenase n=1 Tax=Phaffia rhodozyma TaxID=264483 RepID=A0A0F7SSM8_PHARH|nr:Predicted gamma-butyrobetaine,2-oxoglutarate dioxygenase [Phaffia rhodozyma]